MILTRSDADPQLQNGTVYAHGTLCGSFGDSVAKGVWYEFYCRNGNGDFGVEAYEIKVKLESTNAKL